MQLGCMSHQDKRQKFIDDRNFAVSRNIIETPLEIKALSSWQSEYVYEYEDTGCKWAYIINNKTLDVQSWHYISDPSLCYHYIDWSGTK
jgi:hypothetical protein